MKHLLELFSHANTLKRLPRMGWLLSGISDAESVADHTCNVALLAMMLAEEINQDWAAQGLSAPLDASKVTMIALVHDLAESVVMDLPKRSVHFLGSETKRIAEEKAINHVLAELPNSETYVALWNEYETAATPEARLVKDVDKLEMVYQALCYEQAGHQTLDDFWQGHQWRYPLCAALFDELQKQRVS
ncbi:MAG: HD domain-containing protein [Chloroflexota bacterium]